jgi:hypothetical protein
VPPPNLRAVFSVTNNRGYAKGGMSDYEGGVAGPHPRFEGDSWG